MRSNYTGRAFQAYEALIEARQKDPAAGPGDLPLDPAVRAELEELLQEFQPDAGPAAPPDTSRYRFQALIARGGMGDVWRATDTELHRDVAVKVLRPPYGGTADRLLDEAVLAARLDHPAIVPVYEAGVLQNGRPFFVMKLIRGAAAGQMDAAPTTLADTLARRGSPAENLATYLQLFRQTCKAVEYAHQEGVIHRDLKPSNVLVGRFEDVLVTDWGIAKAMSRTADDPVENMATGGLPVAAGGDTDRTAGARSPTLAGTVQGTFAYMPPEQARGETVAVGKPSDVFGLGGILCEILTGRPTYTAETAEALRTRARNADRAETYVRLDGCGADPGLIALTKKCLATDPAERYPDAGAVAAALKAHLDGGAVVPLK
jgi:eukaryotic-like serine/threonine-protein kinase